MLFPKMLLDHLSGCGTRNEISEAILKTPKDIRELFVRCLRRIKNDEWRLKEQVVRACLWISTATRPLHLDELVEAISIEESHATWDKYNFCDGNVLLTSCSSIIEVDDAGYVRFVHDSVKRFLDEGTPPPDAKDLSEFFVPQDERNTLLVKRCLTYLNFVDFECGASTSREEMT
jgi:hypothetical protein